jgi:hypothetical protein
VSLSLYRMIAKHTDNALVHLQDMEDTAMKTARSDPKAAASCEMSTLADEIVEFSTICKQIDNLLSVKRIKTAERKLRALADRVIDSTCSRMDGQW